MTRRLSAVLLSGTGCARCWGKKNAARRGTGMSGEAGGGYRYPDDEEQRPDWLPSEDEINAMLSKMAEETWREYTQGEPKP
jgi:hypothetical protein